jgi:hypothetical protein
MSLHIQYNFIVEIVDYSIYSFGGMKKCQKKILSLLLQMNAERIFASDKHCYISSCIAKYTFSLKLNGK